MDALLVIIVSIAAVYLVIKLYNDYNGTSDSDPKGPSDYGNHHIPTHNSSKRISDPIKRFLTPEYKIAGMQGEAAAVKIIRSVMRDDDRLFTGVSIEYDGKKTGLDNVIVNKYGVFIIEAVSRLLK